MPEDDKERQWNDAQTMSIYPISFSSSYFMVPMLFRNGDWGVGLLLLIPLFSLMLVPFWKRNFFYERSKNILVASFLSASCIAGVFIFEKYGPVAKNSHNLSFVCLDFPFFIIALIPFIILCRQGDKANERNQFYDGGT
ncbi:hypothetical protein NCG89_14660 [Spongiibacter taiwanensis]|uniref:hypothetical protein n=1 Tax=Spongiibacter taiwanensis TaxID=1748242 RepID=UPI002036544C|nr:hypothetical protein [Spongiibacter taiwanensis]USA42772.1 hypothetical protein NCG89_14660 [Spongiibacter taiwanensis]